jgi:Rps23 Pro-64 3,4-dihydroxylase Tpa1-like proline 4-hydroxylase
MLNLSEDKVKSAAKEFSEAQPYPFIVIDNFLDKDFAKILSKKFDNELQDLDVKHIKSFDSGYGGDRKKQFSPNGCSQETQDQVGFFNQQQFLGVLEKITGIKGLMGDASYEGGGFHQTGKGGRLGVHVDFRVHKRLKLKRELNAIIYLNDEDWDEDWGGGLEIWSRDGTSLEHKVAPKFNRCVIFKTDDSSFHGHPKPLECPDDKFRKSLALYYYTGSDLVFAENSRKTTVYIDGQETDFEFKNKLKYSIINFCLDYLPPVLTRRILGKK